MFRKTFDLVKKYGSVSSLIQGSLIIFISSIVDLCTIFAIALWIGNFGNLNSENAILSILPSFFDQISSPMFEFLLLLAIALRFFITTYALY